MAETKSCPKCGGTCYHNQGISKTKGTPYENWKCKDCEFLEWVGHKKEKVYSPVGPAGPVYKDNNHEEAMEALRKIYAKLLDIEKLYGQQ